jgi:hypothetical protein
MNRTTGYIAVATGILALSAFAGIGAAMGEDDAPLPSVEQVEHQAALQLASAEERSPASLLSILGNTGVNADKLPQTVDPAELGVTGVDPLSSRYLGETDSARFWVAIDRNGQPCLVMELVDDDVVASTCRATAALEKEGIGLQAYGPTSAAEAYLVPDGATLQGDGLERLSLNLVTVDPLDERPRVSGFELRMLPALSPKDLPPTFGK